MRLFLCEFSCEDKMTSDSKAKPLSDRANLLMKFIADQYVQDGQPVGSRTLSKQLNGQLSAATIRNVMADLEDEGYITSPHTSAGRIPTAKGYRLFVDALLTAQPLTAGMVEQMALQLGNDRTSGGLIQSASNLLSGFTQLAGVVTIPKNDQVVLRQIEFLPLNDDRILVIMVINESEVQNRVIQLPSKIDKGQLERAANFINQHYAGKSLSGLRSKIIDDLRDAKTSMDSVIASAMAVTEQLFGDDESDGDYVLHGETNLMGYADLNDMVEMRKLFEAFHQKRDMLYILDQCIRADGIQIFIGEESGYTGFSQCSLVTAPYKNADRTIGVLGVIGPTRMQYDKVVSMVDVTAKLLSAALNSK